MPEQAPPAGGGAMPPPNATSQPPMGVSSATGPTPNKGYEAAALQRVGLVIKQLTDLLPLAGATSEIGKDVLKAISTLAKHVPSGSTNPAAERNEIDRLATQNAQQSQMNKQLRQPAAGGQGAPGGGGMPPGAGGMGMAA